MSAPHRGTVVRYVRRRCDLTAAIVGAGVLAIGAVAVRHGTVTAFEKAVFHAINDLPAAV